MARNRKNLEEVAGTMANLMKVVSRNLEEHLDNELEVAGQLAHLVSLENMKKHLEEVAGQLMSVETKGISQNRNFLEEVAGYLANLMRLESRKGTARNQSAP
mmetsp:Transcript_27611/g.45972  ORF Transcript_27611/g.45972 Transcript_27611/m.45972 type:complete len:102 (-) Transcript_27611:247-552(-)